MTGSSATSYECINTERRLPHHRGRSNGVTHVRETYDILDRGGCNSTHEDGGKIYIALYVNNPAKLTAKKPVDC